MKRSHYATSQHRFVYLYIRNNSLSSCVCIENEKSLVYTRGWTGSGRLARRGGVTHIKAYKRAAHLPPCSRRAIDNAEKIYIYIRGALAPISQRRAAETAFAFATRARAPCDVRPARDRFPPPTLYSVCTPREGGRERDGRVSIYLRTRGIFI